MESLVRLTAEIILLSILSIMVSSATQCGTMSCTGHEECYLFYSYKGFWYYESNFRIRRGLANVAKSRSCYKYVVNPNTLTSSCFEMEKRCIESGGSLAVINSNREYITFNEFILDVTRVESFVPVYRKLLVHVDSLPMAKMNKTCSHIVVKDGLLDDNAGYIKPQPCAEEAIFNSVLCEYSIEEEPDKDYKNTTSTRSRTRELSLSVIPLDHEGAHHHAVRSVHLYDSPLDEWMDKPYFVESQQERLYSSADSTSSSSSGDVPSVDSDKHQHISCDPSKGTYENHRIYASICRELPENIYKFPYENQDAFKDYYNLGTTNFENMDANIVMKTMYNSLQIRPDLEIQTRVNGNNRQSIRDIFYDKLSRSSTRSLLSMPNRYNSRTSDGHEGFELSSTSSDGRTDYHHLDRRCTTIAIGNRSRGEHDYSKLTNVTAT
ncbi:uncharacterized protein LOC117114393 [Anneissia japonica]|uniref:uncharacterized protein LOC117114393 n=1 Tax=Anneissia japonica TaxID=1529436 RepID=UPI0014257633|nr:uncharacterized protein LOC117114393 [Anneissia japonica]